MNQRILLISTVALFLVTGTPVFSVEPRTEKEAAIAAIKKLGGRFFVDRNDPNRPVESVVLSNTKFTDAGLVSLVSLKGLAKLRQLHLVGTQVTDAGLVHLKGLTKLRTLSLGNTKVTDTGLLHLKGLTGIQILGLNDTRITDTGLVHLKELTKLYRLKLSGTKVTDEGLDDLKVLINLHELQIYSTQVTDIGVKRQVLGWTPLGKHGQRGRPGALLAC